MRIFNLIAGALVVIGWAIRFYYFTKRSELVETEVIVAADATAVPPVEASTSIVLVE